MVTTVSVRASSVEMHLEPRAQDAFVIDDEAVERNRIYCLLSNLLDDQNRVEPGSMQSREIAKERKRLFHRLDVLDGVEV